MVILTTHVRGNESLHLHFYQN